MHEVDERQSAVVGRDGMTTGYPRLDTDSGTAQMWQAKKTRARTSFELVEGLGIVEELGMLAGRRKGVECRLTSRRRVSGVFDGKHGGLRREGIYCWLGVLPAGLGRAQL